MDQSGLICRETRRRDLLRERNSSAHRWTGLDYVEIDREKSGKDGTSLYVELLCEAQGMTAFRCDQFKLLEEHPRKSIRFDAVELISGCSHALMLRTAQVLCPGVSYTLKLLCRDDVDPQFATYRFTAFESDLVEIDPRPQPECPAPRPEEPSLNYLARDFGSFRQLLLDRLALSMPQWTERHVPDLGIALVEVFAYVGDYLAWYQDAVATEAYLQTARQRISVRRHARLVDYQLHEGCNARTFLHLTATTDGLLDPDDVFFTTKLPDLRLERRPVLAAFELEQLPAHSYQGFEIVRRKARCTGMSCHDIQNPAGLIGSLIDENSPLQNLLMRALPASLVQEIVEYARTAIAPPDVSLVADLGRALDSIVQQICLWQQLDFTTLVAPEFWQRWLGRLGRPQYFVETNVALLKSALSPYLAKPADTRIPLYRAHNEIRFYTWDRTECCLPIGATRATLSDDSPADSIPGGGTAGDMEISRPYEEPLAMASSYIQRHGQVWNLHRLSAGDLLLFEEVRGPRTHTVADADPSHRQVVRLTSVKLGFDPVNERRIVEIEWSSQDALRFPLCISSIGPAETGCQLREDVSVARGNIVLVDHGITNHASEWLGTVPLHVERPTCRQPSCGEQSTVPPARSEILRPALEESDLTFAAPICADSAAAELFDQHPDQALPSITVRGFPVADPVPGSVLDPGIPPGTLVNEIDLTDPRSLVAAYQKWSVAEQQRVGALLPPSSLQFLQQAAGRFQPEFRPTLQETNTQPEFREFRASLESAITWESRLHLLDSSAEDRHFVVEIDDHRRTRLRFGDDELGRRPPPQMSFYARYRRGNGIIGNVGAEKISHLVYRQTAPAGGVDKVTNPLPAKGGAEPESLDHARQHAPHAFRKLNRAIIADDYAEIVRRDFSDRVQQARGTLRFMGTWYEIAVAIDPLASVRDRSKLVADVKCHLEHYRRIGHLVRVELPAYVGLHIEMTVCVQSGYLRAHVQRELLELFSNRRLPDGTNGFFHPDNFGFGDEIYLSKIVAAAKRVPGVENLDVTRFERRGEGDQGERDQGVMRFAPLEIPLVDNDPLRPEKGCFFLDMRGGR